jgi:hypothetical protein
MEITLREQVEILDEKVNKLIAYVEMLVSKYSIEESRQSYESTTNRKYKCSQQTIEEKIYSIYPRKAGKTEGLKRLQNQIKSESDLFLVKKALENYIRHLAIEETDPKYIKMFSSWTSTWRDWLDLDAGKVTVIPSVQKPKPHGRVEDL